MKRQEISILIVVLALIGLGATMIKFGKLRLGKPGLIVESGTLTNEVGEVVRNERVKLPGNIPGYWSKDGPISNWEITTLPKDTTFGRKFYWSQEGFWAQFSAVLMKSDRTSIHRPQVCVTGQGWTIEKSEVIKIPIATPRPYTLEATCLTIAKEEDQKPIKGAYIFYFISETRLASQHPEALWYLTKDLLMDGTLHPWGYISCFSKCPPGQEEVLIQRMKRLIATTAPEFQATTGAGKETASHPLPDGVEPIKQTASR